MASATYPYDPDPIYFVISYSSPTSQSPKFLGKADNFYNFYPSYICQKKKKNIKIFYLKFIFHLKKNILKL